MRVLGLLLGLGVLALGILAVGWGILGTGEPGIDLDVQPHGPAQVTPDGLEDSGELRTDPDSATGDQEGRVAATTPGSTRAANGISGHVILDPSSPVDEVIELIASASGAHEDWTIEIRPDLTFEVTFPYGSHSCAIRVAGRYHFGHTTFDPHRHEGPLVLRPELGGLVRVRVEQPEPDLVPDKIGARHDNGFVPGVAVEEEGSYEIRGLEAQVKFNVYAEFANWVNPVLRGVRVHPGKITEVTLVVTSGARLQGRVMDEDGSPIVSARLTATSRLGRGNLGPFAGEAEAVTTEDGAFDLRGIPAGWISLSISSKSHARKRVELDLMEEDEARTGIEYVLKTRNDGVISGTVHWPDGQPAGDGRVLFVFPNQSGSQAGFVRRDGSFSIEGLPDGEGHVIAESPGDDVHTAGRTTHFGVDVGTKDLALVLGSTDRLSGQVIDERGDPVSDFTVEAKVVQGDRAMFTIDAGSSSQEGSFDLEGLYDGTWSVQATAEGHAASTAQYVSMPSVSGGLLLRCPRLGTIEGQVTASTGDPIEGATVKVVSAEGTSIDTKTDAMGVFTLSDITPGPVEVTATLRGHAPSEVLRLDIAAGDQRKGLSLSLRTGATLTGEIHSSIANPGSRNVIATRIESYESVKLDVDADGKFERTGIRPGRYFVARDWMGGDDWVLNYASRFEVEVELIEGGTTHVILGDQRPGVVQVVGTVHESGELAAGYTVYVLGTVRGERMMPISISRTNEQGVFELDVPRAGDYQFSIGEQQMAQTVFLRRVSGGSRVELSFDMPTGAVKGRVLYPDGSPAPKRSVSLTLQHAPSETREFGELRLVQTDANGDFEAKSLAAGRYRLRATGIGTTFGKGNYSHSVQHDIIVIDAEATEVTVQLQHQAILEGTLLDGNGHPVPGIQVTALDANGEPHRVWDDDYTDANGHFRLLRVPSGTITVHAMTHDGRKAEATVEALSGETHTVDLQL